MVTAVKRLRLAKNLAVWELAKLADIYPTAYYPIENGKAKIGDKLQKRIAGALNVPAAELFDAQGWPLFIGLEEVGA